MLVTNAPANYLPDNSELTPKSNANLQTGSLILDLL